MVDQVQMKMVQMKADQMKVELMGAQKGIVQIEAEQKLAKLESQRKEKQ